MRPGDFHATCHRHRDALFATADRGEFAGHAKAHAWAVIGPDGRRWKPLARRWRPPAPKRGEREPSGFGLGARVRWRQDGQARSGQVWSRGRSPSSVYVVPDEPGDDEMAVRLWLRDGVVANVESLPRSSWQAAMRRIELLRQAGAVVRARSSDGSWLTVTHLPSCPTLPAVDRARRRAVGGVVQRLLDEPGRHGQLFCGVCLGPEASRSAERGAAVTEG
jgi:hypothetical protein